MNRYLPAHLSRGLFYFTGFVLAVAPITGFARDPVLLSVLACVTTIVFAACVVLGTASFDVRRDLPAVLFVAACWLASAGQFAQPEVRAALLSLLTALELGYLIRYLTADDRARLSDVVIGTAALVTVMLAAGTLFPERFAGMVVNANICAGYILFGFVLAATHAHTRTYRILTVLLFAGIVAAGSRAALIAGFLAVGLYWWRDLPRPARWAYGGAAAAGFLLMLNGLGSDVSLINRLSWWQAGLRMFADHPLFGAGWGSFGSEYLVYRPVVTENTAYAHAIAVQLLAEGGLAGAGLFVLFILSRWSGAGRVSPATAAAGAFLVFNLVDYAWYIPAHQVTFFVVMFSIQARRAEEMFTLPLIARAGIAGLAAACCLLTMPPPGPSAATHASRSGSSFSQYLSTRDTAFLDRAIEHQESAVRAAPSVAVYHADLAWLYHTAGLSEAARREILSAVRRDPLNMRFQSAVRSLIPRR